MSETVTGIQALDKLMEGNKRYVASKPLHPHQTPSCRERLKDDQYPFAAILGCSDSRVPPEVIFDQGLGDLFIVRVAGNVTGMNVLASIEYAVAYLHVPLVVVLGHSNCGAIKSCATGTHFNGNLQNLMATLQPVLDRTKGKPGDLVNNSAKMNAKLVSDSLSLSEPVLFKAVNSRALKIVPAYYDIETGQVTFFINSGEYL
jgi:carbonic anhydrase